MQAEKLAYYPFTSEASAHVGNLGISLESLLNSRAYRAARARGIERVKEALEGEIKKNPLYQGKPRCYQNSFPILLQECWLPALTISSSPGAMLWQKPRLLILF
ncbi:hypothetical protein [Methanosarcina horonobensis]|uniref:hypothetical protein n=1 Tax=Methanosarcina horonobensis TaxID=418008 RepID=UPI000A713496